MTWQTAITKSAWKDATKRTYVAAMKDFVAFAGDAREKWTPEIIKGWRQSIIRRGAGTTPNTYIAAVRIVLGRLKVDDRGTLVKVDREILKKNDRSADKIKLPIGNSLRSLRDRALLSLLSTGRFSIVTVTKALLRTYKDFPNDRALQEWVHVLHEHGAKDSSVLFRTIDSHGRGLLDVPMSVTSVRAVVYAAGLTETTIRKIHDKLATPAGHKRVEKAILRAVKKRVNLNHDVSRA